MHTNSAFSSARLFQEGRLAWREMMEIPRELLEHVPEAQRSAAAERIQRYVREQVQRTTGTGEQRRERGEAAREELPALTNLSEDHNIAVQQLARAQEELLARQRLEQVRHELVVEKTPLVKNALKTGAIAGSVAFIPSYLAYLGSSNALGGLGAAGAGALVGRWIGGPEHKVKGPLIGAATGMVSAPFLGGVLTKLGTHLSTGALLTTAGALAVPAGILGTMYAYKGLRKDYTAGGTKKTFLRNPHGRIVSGAVALSGGALAAIPAAGLGVATHSLFLGQGVQALGGGVTWLGNTLPVYTASIPGLINGGSLILAAGAAGAGLYGLGRLEGRLWKRKPTGIWGNLLRATISPVTLPTLAMYTVGWKLPKYGLRKTKDFVVRNAQATKRIFTGKSKAVKAVTLPVWWPMRTIYRATRGVGKGVYNGITGVPPSETDLQHGVPGKIGRGVGLPIGKTIASPYRFAKWLLSPTWNFDKR